MDIQSKFDLSVTYGIFFLVRKFIYARIVSPASLDKLESSNLIGVIPFVENDNKLKNESFNSLVTNVLFSVQNKSIISISGALKGVGKTYMATNLAKSISKLNKKVVILDCDFHRGDVHESFLVEKLSMD